MAKKGGSKFQNRAARRFKDLAKVDTYSQKEIFEIFDEDMKTMLDQLTAHREHQAGSPYPAYISNAFANLSSALYVLKFAKKHVKCKKGKGRMKTDLHKKELESLRQMVADAYKKSATNTYANQVQEYADRNKILGKAFAILCPGLFRLTKKFKGLTKSQRRDLTIQLWGDPVYNMRFVHKLVNQSTIGDKKKLKLLRKAYGKRWVKAVGAAMTVEGNNSDCLALLFEYLEGLKKKKRAPFLLAYADSYKRNKTRYFRMDQEFFDSNKGILKELKKIDIGFRKSWRELGIAKGGKKDRSKDRGGSKPAFRFATS